MCPTHGGSAPQVKAAAQRRILELAPLAISTLVSVMRDSENDSARVAASRTILQSGGLDAPKQHEVEVTVGADNPALDAAIAHALAVRGLAPGSGDQGQDIVEAEVIEDHDPHEQGT